jgi:NHL repeat
MKYHLLFFLVSFLLVERLPGQIYDTNNVSVQTFAGSGFYGYLDGVGQQTMFYDPSGVVADTFSNLFVVDASNNRIRKITPDGTVTTFAGGGIGSLPGYGTNVSLNNTWGSIAIDHLNTLLVTIGSGLLKIDTNGYVARTNLLGITSTSGVCVDSANNIYYSAYSANKIYRWLTNGQTEVFVGSGNSGAIDGNGVFTSFSLPSALSCDSADNIYVWDGNSRIRRVNQNRDVVTIATSGTAADGPNPHFNSVFAMCSDGLGNLIVVCGTCVRKLSATTNSVTIAGSFGQSGYTNGANNLARFYGASGVCIAGGGIFIADANNQRIRQINFDSATQIVAGANLAIGTYPGISITGVVGRTYQIESSGDLSNWNPETTVLLTQSPYLWIDQQGLGQKKFYRAFLLP